METEEGPKKIEDIVEGRLQVKVLTYDSDTASYSYKGISDWLCAEKLPYQHWLDVVPAVGKHIRCTKSHAFLTERGWVRADQLDASDDRILSKQHDAHWTGLMAGTVLGDSFLSIDKRGHGQAYRLIFTHTNRDLAKFKAKVLGLEGRWKARTTGYGSEAVLFTSRALTLSRFPVDLFYHRGNHELCGMRKVVPTKGLADLLTPEGLALWIADDGSLAMNNGNSLTPVLSISTHRYPDDQLVEFVKYFERKWRCTPTLIQDRRVPPNETRSGKYMKFNTKDCLLILNSLRDKQVSGAEYKFYFPTEGYIQPAQKGFEWTSFRVRKGRHMNAAKRYDLRIHGSDNYVANGVIVQSSAAH